MNKLSLCTNHIEKPFYIKEINKNIYSVEELGYYLYNYLYLIDDEFFGESLINYIENELEQKTIASGLYQIIENRGSLGEKISVVIKNCGYYTEKESERLENHLVMLSSKTATERVKAKADILMENEKFNMAINYYNSILNKAVNTDLEDEFYGNVYNNLGVALARLFEYERAAVAFRMAYRLNNSVYTLEAIINCDLILDDLERLERDVKKYDVSDAVVTRLRNELDAKKKRIKKNWSKAKESKYIQKCKKEYIVEVNS